METAILWLTILGPLAIGIAACVYYGGSKTVALSIGFIGCVMLLSAGTLQWMQIIWKSEPVQIATPTPNPEVKEALDTLTKAVTDAKAIADANELAHRPWISIADIHFVSPLKFTKEEGARYQIFIATKNTGGSPARNVLTDVRVRLNHDQGKAMEAHKRDCAAARNPERFVIITGITMFPGDAYAQTIYAGVPAADVANEVKRENGDRQDVDFLYVVLTGCITYQFQNSNDMHQTPFFFALRRTDINKGFHLGEEIPAAEITFSPSGGWAGNPD